MSFDIPFLGKPSCQFYKNISRLILKVSNVNVMLIYGTFKVGDYFKLKYPISLLLVSDVVYRFTCPCNTDETYIGMSSRHLIIREREYLNLNNNNRKTVIKNHLQQCKSCSKTEINFYL